MRIIRFLFLYLLVSVMGVLILVFLGLNHYTIQLDMIQGEYQVNIVWVIVGAAAFGFVVAMLVLLPGRIAAGLHARSLNREVRDLDHDFRELEHLLDEREEWYLRLLDQHDMLLERHERVLARHEALVDDYSQITAERDKAHAQLAALRIVRPAAGTSGGPALRLLPQSKPAPIAPLPAARPSTPVPVARVESPASPPKPDVESPKQPEQSPATPSPKREATPAKATAKTGDNAPATVPVVTDPPTSDASAPPPADEPASPAKETVAAPPPARRKLAAEVRAGVTRRWQSAGAGLAHTRRHTVQWWRKGTAQVSAQGKTQVARIQRLRQRAMASLATSRDSEPSQTDASTSDASE